MKKSIILACMLCLAAAGSLSAKSKFSEIFEETLSAILGALSEGSEDICDKNITPLVQALDNRDSQGVKDLFSVDAKNKAQNIDSKINRLFDIYRGKHTSIQNKHKGSTGERSNGKYTDLYSATYEVTTDQGKYLIYLQIYNSNKNTNDVGIYNMYIIKPEEEFKSLYYMWRKETAGIVLEDELTVDDYVKGLTRAMSNGFYDDAYSMFSDKAKQNNNLRNDIQNAAQTWQYYIQYENFPGLRIFYDRTENDRIIKKGSCTAKAETFDKKQQAEYQLMFYYKTDINNPKNSGFETFIIADKNVNLSDSIVDQKTGAFYIHESEDACEQTVSSLIQAMDNRDKQAVKKLFSVNARNSTWNLDSKINKLFDSYQGRHNAIHNEGTVSYNAGSGNNSNLRTPYYKVTTDRGSYLLYLQLYSGSSNNENGIYNLYILKEEDKWKEFYYMWHAKTAGITLEDELTVDDYVKGFTKAMSEGFYDQAYSMCSDKAKSNQNLRNDIQNAAQSWQSKINYDNFPGLRIFYDRTENNRMTKKGSCTVRAAVNGSNEQKEYQLMFNYKTDKNNPKNSGFETLFIADKNVYLSDAIVDQKAGVFYINQSENICDRTINSLVQALDNRDCQSVKNLFSTNVRNSTWNLDSKINRLFDIYQGRHSALQNERMSSTGKTVNGSYTDLYTPYYKVTTNKGTYLIYLQLNDSKNNNDTGIYNLYILKEEYRWKEFYYMWHEKNAGITLEDELTIDDYVKGFTKAMSEGFYDQAYSMCSDRARLNINLKNDIQNAAQTWQSSTGYDNFPGLRIFYDRDENGRIIKKGSCRVQAAKNNSREQKEYQLMFYYKTDKNNPKNSGFETFIIADKDVYLADSILDQKAGVFFIHK